MGDILRNVRELRFRVILVGKPLVGKTSIINRVVNNDFQEELPRTKEVSESIRITNNREKKCNIILEILDAPGEHAPTDYMPNFFRNVDAIVMVYDQTNLESFQFISNMTSNLGRLCDKPLGKIAIYIVGNKIDLPIEQLKTSRNMANQLAGRIGAMFFETSAKSSSNIDFLFNTIEQQVINYFDQSNNPIQNQQNQKNQKNEWACTLL